MELVIFIGIQATGKSSFFKERFFNSHVRISLDLLNTRNKEKRFIDTCFSVHQKFVVDNTNPQKTDRLRYIEQAKTNKYKVIGYYFQSKLDACLERNSKRKGKECIPEVGVKATFNKLELPYYNEGFDELYYVELKNGNFEVKEWNNEI